MKWLDRFNNLPQAPIIFFILCLNHFIPVPDANEEMYFGLALQYLDPDWVPGSFSFTESPGTRIFFQWPVGFLLKFLSFEAVSIIGRILCYAFFAVLLSQIFSIFQISNLWVFFLLQVVFNRNQSFVGGEWIFQDFETKTVAYICVLSSILAALKEKWKSSILWAVPAVYFHVLVGGWYFIALFLYMIFRGISLRSLILYGFLFTILVLPFLIYLSSEILIDQRSIINGVNLDWVYTYYRNPHHTVTFYKGWSFFRIHRFDGFLMLMVAGIVGSFAYQKSSDPRIRNLWLFCFATYVILLLGIGISAIDTTGKILKFYVFRIGTVSFLLTCIALLFHLERITYKSRFKTQIAGILMICCIISIPHVLYRKISRLPPSDNDYEQINEFIRDNTPIGSVILGYSDAIDFGFIRETQRDLFVSHKYVPSGGEKLYEWYIRMEARKQLENDFSFWQEFKSDHHVDYILAKRKLSSSQDITKIYSKGHYNLYQVENTISNQ